MWKKTASFDIAKFICAILVITIHTYPFLNISQELNTFVVSGVARVAVPLFFVISAYFFFQHDEDHIGTYLKRIGKLYVIWSLLYLPFYIIANKDFGLTIMIVKYIRNFFFIGSHYHLWFLPALMFAIYVVNYFHRYYDMKKLVFISGILYLIGYLGNIYFDELYQIPYLAKGFDYYVQVFSTTRNGLFFGIPYVVMGYCCTKFQPVKTSLQWFGTVIGWSVVYLAEVALLNHFYILDDLSCMYLSLIPLVYVLFRWLQSLDIEITTPFIIMRKMSLLIYVSHILIYMLVCRIFVTCTYFELFMITCGMTLVFSGIVIFLSKWIPLLKHLYE